MSANSERDTLVAAFSLLTASERQLLICALAGNFPPKLAHLRMEVLRGLAKADRVGVESAHVKDREAEYERGRQSGIREAIERLT
jgi:hypothetical protein